MKKWIKLAGDTRGATMVEYVVIITLILIAALTAWRALGTAVAQKTQQAAQALQ
jgi:Flp pilus assembly pilin Flp